MPKWRKLAKGFELHAQSTQSDGVKMATRHTARLRRKRRQRQRQRQRLSVAPHAPPPLAGDREQTCKFADEIKLKAHTFHADNRRAVPVSDPPLLSLPAYCSIHIHSEFVPPLSHMSQILDANLRVFINFNFNLAKSPFEFYFELCLSKLLLFS